LRILRVLDFEPAGAVALVDAEFTFWLGSQDSLLRLLLLSVWLIGNAVALDQENPSTDLTHGTVTTIALHGF